MNDVFEPYLNGLGMGIALASSGALLHTSDPLFVNGVLLGLVIITIGYSLEKVFFNSIFHNIHWKIASK